MDILKTLSVLAVGTLFSVNIYMAFSVGVQVGNAQTHTETVIMPPVRLDPIVPSVPPAPVTPAPGKLHSMSYTFSDKDEECLALNVYWEARDQNLKGKIAIGLVTMQRVASKHYPNTVCDVVWQQNKDRNTGRIVAQFSWTLDGKNDTPKNAKAWTEAKLIASSFAGDGSRVEDFTNGSYLYHADYVKPYWRDSYTLMAQIGSHLFYK